MLSRLKELFNLQWTPREAVELAYTLDACRVWACCSTGIGASFVPCDAFDSHHIILNCKGIRETLCNQEAANLVAVAFAFSQNWQMT